MLISVDNLVNSVDNFLKSDTYAVYLMYKLKWTVWITFFKNNLVYIIFIKYVNHSKKWRCFTSPFFYSKFISDFLNKFSLKDENLP